eukprot:scaffold27703_cov75-Phaeocystis_antarctica.AAC.11
MPARHVVHHARVVVGGARLRVEEACHVQVDLVKVGVRVRARARVRAGVGVGVGVRVRVRSGSGIDYRLGSGPGVEVEVEVDLGALEQLLDAAEAWGGALEVRHHLGQLGVVRHEVAQVAPQLPTLVGREATQRRQPVQLASSALVSSLVWAHAQGEGHARVGAGAARQAVEEGGECPRARDGDERHGGVVPGAAAELAHDLLRGLKR